MSSSATGSTVIFEPSGECRSANCDNCQRFFQPIPDSTGTCICGHNYAFHATLSTQPSPLTSAFTHAPNIDRFQTARSICLPSTPGQMTATNSLYTRVPATATPPTNSPYAPSSGDSGFSAPVFPAGSSAEMRGLTVGGVEASLGVGSGTPYDRRLREMASRSSRGRGRSSRVSLRLPPVREFRATFTYLRHPYRRNIPNGMSAEHKRLESRGLCNIPIAFNLNQDTSEDAVKRIITDALSARGLGLRAGDWKVWRILGSRGVGSLQPLARDVVMDLETLQYCCRCNNKNNFYITPKSGLFTLSELHNLTEWFTNYTSRGEIVRCWAGWQEIDERERQEHDAQEDTTGVEVGEAGPSIRRTRSRAQMEDESDDDETYLPPRRRRRTGTQITDCVYRPRGRPPHGAAPTVRISELPDSPPILPESPTNISGSLPPLESSINISGSQPPESPASPASSISITEPATPEADSSNGLLSRRSQLADPGSDMMRFERVISKVLELYGSKTTVREEDRITWAFERNPYTWLDTLFDFLSKTPWVTRTSIPRPRMRVDHPDYRRGMDCGGVFKAFLHTNIREFVDGEDFVNEGFLGRLFRQDYESTHPSDFEPPPPHFRKYEMFGKLMASYMFCHREFPWPRGLDPVIFLVAYSRFKGTSYAPHSSRVVGALGQAMRILEVWDGSLPAVPQILYDFTDTIGWTQETVQENLRTPEGIEAMRVSLYWNIHWKTRAGGLDAFIRGLNERNLFQTMAEDENLQFEDIDCWLLQSGIPSAQSVRAILSFSSGHRPGDRGLDFQEKYERVQSLFVDWIKWSDRVEGGLEALDWLVKEVFGTSFVGNTKMDVVITTRVGGNNFGEGLMQFSTCLGQLKLSVKLLEEYGTFEGFAQLMEMQRVSSTGGVEFSNA